MSECQFRNHTSISDFGNHKLANCIHDGYDIAERCFIFPKHLCRVKLTVYYMNKVNMALTCFCIEKKKLS